MENVNDLTFRNIFLIILIPVFLFLILLSCENRNISGPVSVNLEGTWYGSLDGDSLFLTLIQGLFEDSPTLTGSGSIISDSIHLNYLIMGGTITRDDSVIFSLNPPNSSSKESYFLKGFSSGNRLDGIYRKYNEQGILADAGNWKTIRIP